MAQVDGYGRGTCKTGNRPLDVTVQSTRRLPRPRPGAYRGRRGGRGAAGDGGGLGRRRGHGRRRPLAGRPGPSPIAAAGAGPNARPPLRPGRRDRPEPAAGGAAGHHHRPPRQPHLGTRASLADADAGPGRGRFAGRPPGPAPEQRPGPRCAARSPGEQVGVPPRRPLAGQRGYFHAAALERLGVDAVLAWLVDAHVPDPRTRLFAGEPSSRALPSSDFAGGEHRSIGPAANTRRSNSRLHQSQPRIRAELKLPGELQSAARPRPATLRRQLRLVAFGRDGVGVVGAEDELADGEGALEEGAGGGRVALGLEQEC